MMLLVVAAALYWLVFGVLRTGTSVRATPATRPRRAVRRNVLRQRRAPVLGEPRLNVLTAAPQVLGGSRLNVLRGCVAQRAAWLRLQSCCRGCASSVLRDCASNVLALTCALSTPLRGVRLQPACCVASASQHSLQRSILPTNLLQHQCPSTCVVSARHPTVSASTLQRRRPAPSGEEAQHPPAKKPSTLQRRAQHPQLPGFAEFYFGHLDRRDRDRVALHLARDLDGVAGVRGEVLVVLIRDLQDLAVDDQDVASTRRDARLRTSRSAITPSFSMASSCFAPQALSAIFPVQVWSAPGDAAPDRMATLSSRAGIFIGASIITSRRRVGGIATPRTRPSTAPAGVPVSTLSDRRDGLHQDDHGAEQHDRRCRSS